MLIVLPEIIVTFTALFAFALGLTGTKEKPSLIASVVMSGLIAACVSLIPAFQNSGDLLGGRFSVDGGALWFKLIFLLAALFAVILSTTSFGQKSNSKTSILDHCSEFNVLLLLTVLGMMFLVSSRDLVTMYVSLELATIPLFLLSAWSKTSHSSEAGLKYVVLGAVSSALLLFGMSIMYGLCGEMQISTIVTLVRPDPAFWFALSLIGAGVGFKLALFPFHMWAPDVYEGSPTSITAFLSIASKTAGVALAVLLFAKLAGSHLGEWSPVIALISALTMTLGNVAAIAQHNIKRFMAYSSISQAGYILMGFIGGAPEGYPAILYYLLGYLVTNIAVFSVIVAFSHQSEREEITDYAGLSQTRPFLALVMMIGLFSLAGIPPLAGFTGKFFLFSIAAKSGYYWLVTLAAVNSTVSLYYYLKIVRQMYIEPPAEAAPAGDEPTLMTWALTLTLAGTILIGLLPVFYESIAADTRAHAEDSRVNF